MNQKQEAGSKQQEVLAVVMARGGSVGLPNKSLRHLLGKPVLSYTLNHVRESKLITRSVVSSDSPEILTLASSEGFDVIKRPEELATATSATDPVVRHAVRALYPGAPANSPRNGSSPSHVEALGFPAGACSISDLPFAVVMLYGNIPLRANHMIDRAIQMLIDTDADSVQTIAPVGKFHPYWMFDYTPDGKIKKHIPNNIFRRQDLPPLYSPTGAVYVMKTKVLMDAENNRDDPHAFLGTDRRALIVAPEDSVDIDTEKDLYVAEAMLRVQALSPKD